jgi:hypothetical protein
VEAAFREAVELWADEQFEVLWERGLLSSRDRRGPTAATLVSASWPRR